MKIRSLILGIFSVIMLAGCSGMSGISNPFAQPSLEESYISQFRDIPIPAPMTSNASESLVTVGPDGSKFGLEAFSGRVDSNSLSSIMMQNMGRQGWQLRGSSVGMRFIQLYEKAPHYAVIFYREGVLSTDMDVWVVNSVNADILSIVPPVPMNNAAAASDAGQVTPLTF